MVAFARPLGRLVDLFGEVGPWFGLHSGDEVMEEATLSFAWFDFSKTLEEDETLVLAVFFGPGGLAAAELVEAFRAIAALLGLPFIAADVGVAK